MNLRFYYISSTLKENGRPRYTEAQKQQVRQSIEEMIELIHQKDYFTIAKDVRKSRMRPYITKFLRFRNADDEELCREIRSQNILVVDDITTRGSTLNKILRTLRILNESNTSLSSALLAERI